jgi:integrase
LEPYDDAGSNVPSVWVRPRPTGNGRKRYRVEYRLGGRESKIRYGGSFKTRREANARKGWIAGELAALRVPNIRLLDGEVAASLTLRDAAKRWRESRVDVAESTQVLHRVALDRVLPILGGRRVDEISVADVADLVARLHADGRKRETIAKSVTYLAQTLDHAGVEPNPARDKRHVKLPREERDELEPPTAAHVEAVYRRLPAAHRVPLLWLDWSGARVGTVDKLRASDYDRSRRRVRLRATASKTRRALWVDVPDDLANAIEQDLDAREPDTDARLFADSGSDALRTAIGKACAALEIPRFSPHDLRHRRISLLHRQGRSWAEIGAFVGQRSALVTSDVYTHVLLDDREVDYRALLALSA